MKKRIIIIAIILVIVCLLAWRFWPQSFSRAIPFDEDAVMCVSGYAMVGLFGEELETYYLDIPQPQSGCIGEILEILDTSRYQQDYRNLWPWGVDHVDADRNYDGHTASVQFVFGNEKDDYITIQFLSSSMIAVSRKDVSGFRIYHPTNRETMYDLVEYLQTHGTKQ